MKTFLRLMREEAGQVLIEYVLILTIMMGVILGGLYQLNTSFRGWADSYFGDYFACLIETGELPSLGAPGATECSQYFREFTIANGWEPRPGGEIAGGGQTLSFGGGGVGAGGLPSSGVTGNFNGSSAGDYEAGDGGGAVVVQSRPASASLGASSSSPTRFRTASASGAAGGKDGSDTGSSSITDLSGYKDGKVVRIPVRDSSGFVSNRRFYDDEEKEKQLTPVTGLTQGAGAKTDSQLIKLERKAASDDKAPEIEEFTFGKLFRYLLIGALIIAIVIFIGGQALQVSKSME